MANHFSRVLVTGASGPIGGALLPSLRARGLKVTTLVRGQNSGESQRHWDPSQPLNPELVSRFDAVIHLAGEPVVGRWTAAKKTAIRDSRVLGTRHLSKALATAKDKPRVFVTASAVGFYGDRGDEILTEDSPSGTGFFPDVCREWEGMTRPAAEAGIRTVHTRFGIVLSPKGGALGAMLPVFRMGIGGRIASGRQWMSWIHIQDLVGAIHHVLNTDLLQGAVNFVSPRPVTNAEFTRTLASALSRPAMIPVPAFMLRLIFGEMADEALLGSQRVEPVRLITSGYPFQYSDLRKALAAVLSKAQAR
jgi:uncharacterized protein (TIGR01777 family)